jgi:GntR family transcriptional regulator of vanillate catabolism
MDSIDSELAVRIRNDIVLGVYPENERLSEAKLCDTHSVSRTPVRMALRLLEQEGLVRRSDGRGYRVNTPKVDDILKAVAVRGHLESLAARLMAQQSDRGSRLSGMKAAIDEIERLLDTGKLDDATLMQMQQQNARFHQTILDGCGNDYVGFTCARISHLPMLEVGSMMFDRQVMSSPEGLERTMFRLRLGNSQHRVISEAIASGDAVRAEGMMREHSNIMVEYIKVFEKRNEELTIKDLIGYSTPRAGDAEDSL